MHENRKEVIFNENNESFQNALRIRDREEGGSPILKCILHPTEAKLSEVEKKMYLQCNFTINI